MEAHGFEEAWEEQKLSLWNSFSEGILKFKILVMTRITPELAFNKTFQRTQYNRRKILSILVR